MLSKTKNGTDDDDESSSTAKKLKAKQNLNRIEMESVWGGDVVESEA